MSRNNNVQQGQEGSEGRGSRLVFKRVPVSAYSSKGGTLSSSGSLGSELKAWDAGKSAEKTSAEEKRTPVLRHSMIKFYRSKSERETICELTYVHPSEEIAENVTENVTGSVVGSTSESISSAAILCVMKKAVAEYSTENVTSDITDSLFASSATDSFLSSNATESMTDSVTLRRYKVKVTSYLGCFSVRFAQDKYVCCYTGYNPGWDDLAIQVVGEFSYKRTYSLSPEDAINLHDFLKGVPVLEENDPSETLKTDEKDKLRLEIHVDRHCYRGLHDNAQSGVGSFDMSLVYSIGRSLATDEEEKSEAKDLNPTGTTFFIKIGTNLSTHCKTYTLQVLIDGKLHRREVFLDEEKSDRADSYYVFELPPRQFIIALYTDETKKLKD